MRALLILGLSFCYITTKAQPAVKTIPGVLKHDPYGVDRRSGKAFLFSASQKTIATRGASGTFLVLDPQKGTHTVIDGDMSGISPDHRYAYKNSIVTDAVTKETMPVIISRGIFSDTITRYIKLPFLAMGMDDRNNLIVTKLLTDENKTVWRVGLYRVDRVTGKELETLRSDTLCSTSQRWDACSKAEMLLEKNYLLWAEKRNSPEIKILPFGSSEVVLVNEIKSSRLSTDSSIFYSWIYTDKGYQLKGYDVNTGKFAGQKIYPWTPGQQHKFFFTQRKIYFYNPNEGMLYEDEPAGDTMRTLRSWHMSSLLRLPASQEWDFALAPGPSFLFYPIWINKAEAGGAMANTASLFNAATDKTTLQIFPFFTRSSDEAAEKKASDERFAAYVKEQAAKDPCKIGWDVPGYQKGIARMYDGVRYILQKFDCKSDLYTVVQAPDLTKSPWEDGYKTSTRFGKIFRQSSTLSEKQYYTCTACDGDGSTLVTRYTTKTKELPWGYFSGIETKSIRTTATTSKETCKVCRGFGIVLK